MRARPVTPDDRQDIFDWRNDALTREMSRTTEPVTWEDHCAWFARSLASDSRVLLMCEISASDATPTTKTAVVFFDIESETASATVSINLAPSMRGRGLGRACLDVAIATLSAAHPELTRLDALIKPMNHASRRSFEQAGFAEAGSKDGLLLFQRSLGPEEITLARIVPTDAQIQTLYQLLTARQHSISHKALPPFEDHRAFVEAHPYRAWFLVRSGTEEIGSIYIGQDNAIGINIAQPITAQALGQALNAVTREIAPLPPIPSVRAKDFFINVPTSNTALMQQLEALGYGAIQTSFQKR